MVRLAFLEPVAYNRPMEVNMTDKLKTVPEDVDEFFDVDDYEAVEDSQHGDDELGDIPDEEVSDLG